jgi:hypothetical protein
MISATINHGFDELSQATLKRHSPQSAMIGTRFLPTIQQAGRTLNLRKLGPIGGLSERMTDPPKRLKTPGGSTRTVRRRHE